jgi:hypothetical protein
MNNNTRRILIWELNQKINQYVHDHDLFCGGCCYTAYVLAAALKHAGIKYRTVIWQYLDILKERDFNNAINGNGISHVAIEVNVLGEKVILGDTSDISNFFALTGYDYRIRKYDGISPEELLNGYKKNRWNVRYNTEWNKHLTRDVRKITAKYSSEPKIKVSYKRQVFTFEDFLSMFFR